VDLVSTYADVTVRALVEEGRLSVVCLDGFDVGGLQ
jgi:hypothetical protein